MLSQSGFIILGLALAAALTATDAAGYSRQKRFKETGCSTSPTTDEENCVDDGETFNMECSFDQDVQSCIWTHYEPMNEGESVDHDIICSGGTGTDENCDGDTRIRVSVSGSKCELTVSDSTPEDSGKWKLAAVSISQSGTVQDKSTEFTVYTYNQSTVILRDEDNNEIDSWDTTYNRNDKQNKWEDDKNNFESVEFSCSAYGGRPIPTFKWFIENNDNDDLQAFENFRITEGQLSTEDKYGFIPNYESTISFAIDEEFMTFLEDQGVDVNPENEEVRFDLNCEVEQGTTSFVQREPIEMRIEKSYDNGALPADTIGIIVGVVIAVILLVLVIACLAFAKNSNRWCFADDDPNNRNKQKGGAAAAGGKGQQQQPQQQYKSAAPSNQARGGTGGGGGGGRSTSGGQSQQVASKESATMIDRNHSKYNPSPSIIKKKPASPSYQTKSSRSTTPPSYRSYDNDSTNKRLLAKQRKMSTSSEDESAKTATASFKGEWIVKQAAAPPNLNSAPPARPPKTSDSYTDSSIRSRSRRRSPSSSSSSDQSPPPPPRPLKSAPVNYSAVDVASNRKSFMNDPRNQVLPMIRTQETTTTTEYASIMSSSKVV